MNRIDEIVRGSFSSAEKSAEVHEVAFNIKWQIQQCLRDELDGNPDLGPVLTVTGNSLHAWATSCHEYIQATWKEAAIGEQFLIDLEILLGKNFPSLGQYNNDHSAMRDYLFFIIKVTDWLFCLSLFSFLTFFDSFFLTNCSIRATTS